MAGRMRRARTRRPEADGSALRWPGAANRFALFGEVMWVGILVVACSLPIVTLPAALAAGIRHLRRYLAAEASGAGLFLRDAARASIGGSIIGAIAVLGGALLGWDVLLAFGGRLPGGPVVGAVGAAGLVALAILVLLAAAGWTPERGWRHAVRSAPAAVGGDPVGATYLLAGIVLTVVVSWQLIPLIVPGIGCLVFATVAVAERRR